jgi:uncharacterized protein involved in exopolysaccharide biosynthesis
MITRNSTYENGPIGSAPGGAREVCRILFRHKRKMAVVFFTTLGLAVVGLMLFPREYSSEARLLVRLGKESVGLDPTAALGQTVSVDGTREHEINSELEILRSRVLAEDVVERIGADEILDKGSGEGEDGAGGGSWLDLVFAPLDMAKTWLTGEISPVERAVTQLERAISITSPHKSNVIVVACAARNPELAQRILNAYLDAYMLRHAKANRTSGSYDFFVDQSDLLREQLTLATEELRDAKNKGGLASIEGQRASIQSQADSIEAAMLENQRALSSSEAKIGAMKKTLGELPEKQLAEESDTPNSAAEQMRAELYKVQIQESELSSRYTALHPQVIAMRRQLEETRRIYAQEQVRSSHSTKRLSPVHQSIQTELASALAMAAGQKAESDSLKRQFEAVQNKIRALNDNELRITELSRRVELLEASYRNYATYREQARIDEALESERISNVNMVQPPSFVAKPSSPRIRLTLLLAFCLATFASLLVPFVAEYLDRSLKTPEQAEQELGIPVLFSVPRTLRNELLVK